MKAEIPPLVRDRIRYKVLCAPDLTSTGLLHSKIVHYRKFRWNRPAEPVAPDKNGPGGLWANRTKSQAKSLQKYLKTVHRMKTVIFVCLVGRVLYQSSYRTKTDKLYLIEQIN